MIYASEKTLSEKFDISRFTVYRKVRQMQGHPVYRDDVIRHGRFVRVKIKSFEEFIHDN